MEFLDVLLFGVILMVGYGFARMGFQLCSRPAGKVIKEGEGASAVRAPAVGVPAVGAPAVGVPAVGVPAVRAPAGGAAGGGAAGGGAAGGGAGGGGQDGLSSKIARLVPGFLFTGFGMFIIWMAVDRYLPLVLDGNGDRTSSTEDQSAETQSAKTRASEVMGEALLKVTVLRPTSSTGESEPAVPKVSVQVERLSLDDNSWKPSGGQWKWIDVVHQKPLPRPSLFAGNP